MQILVIKEKKENDPRDADVNVDMEIETNHREDEEVAPMKEVSLRPTVNHDRFARSAPRTAAATTKKVIDMNMGFSDSDSEHSDED